MRSRTLNLILNSANKFSGVIPCSAAEQPNSWGWDKVASLTIIYGTISCIYM